jgi:protein-S-isoprenylcysteine O-methyltransferase Ste14
MKNKLMLWAALSLVFGGGMLALSGEWRSPLMWTFLAGMSLLMLYAFTAMASDLASERYRPPTQGIDGTALRWIRIVALATVVVSPLDGGRFHWSPPIPDPVRLAALIGCLAAVLLCFRSMIVNRFFSVVIRIQEDRGHRVVDSGPYALVRHPGYAGMILAVPLMALALGSLWGLGFALTYSLLILQRVRKEDRYLQSNLPGYGEYAARVTSRLIPGIW